MRHGSQEYVSSTAGIGVSCVCMRGKITFLRFFIGAFLQIGAFFDCRKSLFQQHLAAMKIITNLGL